MTALSSGRQRLVDDLRLGRKEPNMMIIGVDYHPSFQTIAFFDEETGEYDEQELNRSDGKAERFYQDLQQRGIRVRVGMEATLLAEVDFELWVGDPAEIKAKRVRKPKTDREDARLLLRLMVKRTISFPWFDFPWLTPFDHVSIFS